MNMSHTQVRVYVCVCVLVYQNGCIGITTVQTGNMNKAQCMLMCTHICMYVCMHVCVFVGMKTI